MANRQDYIYDELICFLGNPFFQVPVLTFMEEQCIIFDSTEENHEEYKKVHNAYKSLVTQLLDAFKKDTGLQDDQIIKALQDMNEKADLKEIFQAMFEQVLAMDNYNIFVRIMAKKNIELQEQALAMLMQKQGVLPHSLREAKDDPPPPTQSQLYSVQNEEEILKAVLEQSKREYEEEQAKKKSESIKKTPQESPEVMAHYASIEQNYLSNTKKEESKKLEQALKGITLDSVPSGDTVSNVSKSPQKSQAPYKSVPQAPLNSAPTIAVTPTVAKAPQPAPTIAPPAEKLTNQKLPAVSPSASQVSSSEAAANWMKQAHEESTNPQSQSAAVQARAAEMAKLNPEELKKRQEFLKQQRDKLLEMKKKEREKQLLMAEKSQPKRPSSARVAKNVLEKGSGESTKLSPDEEKKLAMRKAIADRLKAEMLGNK